MADDARLSLEDARSLADTILRLTEEAVDALGAVEIRDRNDVILVSAFGRAYRCLRSIREQAAREEADDASVLVRTLLSIALRALYIVQPEDREERERRLAQWVGKSRREQRLMIEELKELGYGFSDEDMGRALELEEGPAWAGSLPSDKGLAREVGLSQFYSHVYRSTSDATHYGIFTMVEGFDVEPKSVSGEGAKVALDKRDPSRAADALVYGVVVFGAFLEKSDPILRHGITEEALALVKEALPSDEDEGER